VARNIGFSLENKKVLSAVTLFIVGGVVTQVGSTARGGSFTDPDENQGRTNQNGGGDDENGGGGGDDDTGGSGDGGGDDG